MSDRFTWEPGDIELTSAGPTMSKPEAHYRSGGTPGHRCGDCTMMHHLKPPDFESGDCTLVKGLIEVDAVCDHFKLKAGHDKGDEVIDLGYLSLPWELQDALELDAAQTQLARVSGYQRVSSRGRVEHVSGYVTRREPAAPDEHGWIPLDDWLKGQREWAGRGEAIWEQNEWKRRARGFHAAPDADLRPPGALRPGDHALITQQDGSQAEAVVSAATKERDKVSVAYRPVRSAAYPPITSAENEGHGRAVSYREFQRLAAEGHRMLTAMQAGSRPPAGLTDHWQQVKDDAWAATRQSWGGGTYDTATGDPLPQGADKFALSVKPSGMASISVPEDAPPAQFSAAMDAALTKFAPLLARQSSYLGVFHDDDHHRVDIDPVTVVDSIHEVEALGSYAHSIGGAYRFSDGNGYWPPYVPDEEIVRWTSQLPPFTTADPASGGPPQKPSRLPSQQISPSLTTASLEPSHLVPVLSPIRAQLAPQAQEPASPPPPEPDAIEVTPLLPGTPSALPVLYPDQRRILEASVGHPYLGLTSSQAMARIRQNMPLSSEQLTALYARTGIAARSAPAPRARALHRIMDQLMAAQREIRAGEASDLEGIMPLVERTTGRGRAVKSTAGQIATGDFIVWRDLDGQTSNGQVRAVSTQRHGRLVTLTTRDSAGDDSEHLFSARTVVYRLPDLPPDRPQPPPGQTGREWVTLDQLKPGDTIEWLRNREPAQVRSIVPNGLDTGRIDVVLADGTQTALDLGSVVAGGLAAVRIGRGELSKGQPYDQLIPAENPQVIRPDELQVGDLVHIGTAHPIVPGGRSDATGTVSSIERVTGEDGTPGLRVDLLQGGNMRFDLNTYTYFPETGPSAVNPSPSHYAGGRKISARKPAGPEDLHWDMTFTRLTPAAANPLARYADPGVYARERIAGGLWQTFKRAYQEMLDALSGISFDSAEAYRRGSRFVPAGTPPSERAPGAMRHVVIDMLQRMGNADQFAGGLSVRTDYLMGSAAGQMVPGGIDGRGDLLREAKLALRPLQDQMIGLALSQAIAAVENAADDPQAIVNAIQALSADPPLTGVAVRTLAAAAQRMAEQATGTAAYISQPPEVPLEIQGQRLDMSSKMAAYRAALGDMSHIGQVYVMRSLFAPPTLADLQAGRAPEIREARVWVTDKAPDDGPGSVTMGQNEVIRAAGRVLHEEVKTRGAAVFRRITGLDMTAGGVAEAKRQAKMERDRLLRRAEEQWSAASRAGDAARNEYARQHGFEEFGALVDAADLARRFGPGGQAPSGETWLDLLADAAAVYRAAYDPIAARARELTDQATGAFGRAMDLDHAAAQARREAAISVLSEARGGEPFGGHQLKTTMGRGAAKDRARLLEGIRYGETAYPRSWLQLADAHGTSSSWQGYTVGSKERGDYSDAARKINLSDSEPQLPGQPRSGRVATHELGHAMERSVPGLRQMELAELWRRTSVGPPGRRSREIKHLMSGYSGEYARSDLFPLEYSGKDYGDDDAFELFTTGVESLLAGSPYLDEEFEQWMLGVMALLPGGQPFTGAAEAPARAAETGRLAVRRLAVCTHLRYVVRLAVCQRRACT